MSLTTPDAELDAAALMRAFLTQDREAVRVILTHADHAALVVELADLAAMLLNDIAKTNRIDATAFIDEWRNTVIANGRDA